MKVKLFTHTDLDGCGCAIVANHVFHYNNVDVTYCDYEKINEKVEHFINSREYNRYDLVLITDISVNEEVAELIDGTINFIDEELMDADNRPRKLILLDHHNSASWLNKYWWATVTSTKLVETTVPTDGGYDAPDGYEMKTSGTSMLYDYVIELDGVVTPEKFVNLHMLFRFVEKVRRYDTWDWFNVYNDQHAKALNDLLYLIGRERFVNRFSHNVDITFSDTEELLLQVEQEKIKKYIERVSRTVVKNKLLSYTAGFVFAEQYVSELGNVIATNRTDVDFVVIVNLADCSLSFRGVRDDIDLGKEIASVFGGGGHPKSAGAKLDKNLRSAIISKMFRDTLTDLSLWTS